MNREIKFRGKRLSDGSPTDRWAYGSLRCDYGGINSDSIFNRDSDPELYSVGIRACEIYDPKTHNTYAVSSDTVGQYTGLRDRRGQEVYEGDVVFWLSRDMRGMGCGEQGAIFWDKHTMSWAILRDKPTSDGRPCVISRPFDKKHLEVVGNIFDNPDLIAQELYNYLNQ